MKKKLLVLFLIITTTILSIYGCDNSLIPVTMSLEDSIREIIVSKGQDYDFLSDELFLNKIKELGFENKYAIGNLDDDHIPEIVEFINRNPEDMEDEGRLNVYGFDGEKYVLKDSISMNYDNDNYLLEIGKIGPNQNGLLLSNHVGAHSSITYGYVLENGKLKSILNEKKLPLVSVSSINEIKDIDQDGILEFSIYTIDPESIEQSTAGSDKILLWYKWDGKDSGQLVKFERIAGNPEEISNLMEISQDDIGFEIPRDEFIEYTSENLNTYDRFQMTSLLESYIDGLESEVDKNTDTLNLLLNKYSGKENKNLLWDKYGLSSERLNNRNYLKRERILQSELELKNFLIHNIDLGYKLSSSNEDYRYLIDYQRLLDVYGKNITNEYRIYLTIRAKESNEPFMTNDILAISREKLADRIASIESFRLTYPYSSYLAEMNKLFEDYAHMFIFSNDKAPLFDETGKYNEGSIVIFRNTIENHPNTYFSHILKEFINSIRANNLILNEEIKDNITDLINI